MLHQHEESTLFSGVTRWIRRTAQSGLLFLTVIVIAWPMVMAPPAEAGGGCRSGGGVCGTSIETPPLV